MNQINILRKKLKKNVGILIQDTVIIRRSSSLDYHNYHRGYFTMYPNGPAG